MHFGPLEKLLTLDHGAELCGIDKPVFPPVLLTRPRIAGRKGDRQMNIRLLFKEQTNQCGFTGTGRCGDDVETSRHGRF
ncbi:MAG: hypothetical protein ACD_10C00669G0001 [uncultured bacterium]|nr:MAG: hypothetical protein ACD_10C00669G0001 [uncultured bacterium]